MVGHCGICKKWYDDDAYLEFKLHLIAHHDGKNLCVSTVGKGTFKMEVAYTVGGEIVSGWRVCPECYARNGGGGDPAKAADAFTKALHRSVFEYQLHRIAHHD